jgi:hypothetical protein
MRRLICTFRDFVAVMRRYVSSDRAARHANRSTFASLDEIRA